MKLLVVVDYQVDFVSGSLGFKKAIELEDYIVSLINEYHKENDQVIYTLDTHQEDYLETVEGKKLPIKHCIKGTIGHDLYGKVKEIVSKQDLIFEKETFGSKELFYYLEKNNFEEIRIVGLVSNICVLANTVLVKTAQPNSRIIVDAKGTASFDDDLNQKTFDLLESLHIDVINR